jgi:nucleolin
MIVSSHHQVKSLRKQVLMVAHQASEAEAESDKAGKKLFKKQVQALESDGRLALDADGTVTLSKEEMKNKDKKKSKKDKKKRKHEDREEKAATSKKDKKAKEEEEEENEEEEESGNDNTQNGGDNEEEEEQEVDIKDKNNPCPGNPMGCTRLFVGNLPFAVNEESMGQHFGGKGAKITHIKWITDKEDGHFYGSAFMEMRHSLDAATAVNMKGKQLMGRSLKVNFAPARPGDIWPPEDKVVTGSQRHKAFVKAAGGVGKRAMSEKPEGCLKLFIGNLSYEIDDDQIFKFFAAVDAEMKAVRWIHHKDTNDFKGVGFVEFWNPEACEKAAALNGKPLLGRPIRIDWSD